MLRSRTIVVPALLACVVACGGGGEGDDDHDHDAASGIDADPNAPDADPGAPDASESPDASTSCGTMVAPIADLGGTEGIAIAADGTIYYSQSGGRVGRWQPGETNGTDNWVTLAGAGTVWGMAVNAEGMLYVATPASGGAGIIWEVDTTAASPSATMLYPNAGNPNGLTLGPDGAIYYGNFAGSGHVYRLTTAGVRTQVTTATISQPNGVLFDADGTLLVASYSSGDILRLTLDASMQETARDADAFTGAGNPDGLARDAMGRIYVTNNSGGDVLRYTLGAPTPETLEMNAPSAANMAFGRGALDCEDLYVTSSGTMKRLDAGATGVP